jgi:alpha-aminoadipate/glutamate carrier protein LysW
VPIAACPECGAELHVEEEMDKGDIVSCEECESRLEVVGLDPIELDLAPDDKLDDYDDGYENNDDY